MDFGDCLMADANGAIKYLTDDLLQTLGKWQEFIGQWEITQTYAAGISCDSSRSMSSASSLAEATSAAALVARLCSNSLMSSEPRFSPSSYHTMSGGYFCHTMR
eukprot:70015-Pleurochrysis_carterae.AAC.1